MKISRRILAVAVVFAAIAGALGPATPASAAMKRWKAKVVRVSDGDTILVDIGRTRKVVRFAGVNTMETGTCHARQAKRLIQRMGVKRGRTVWLYAQRNSMANKGRILRFVHNARGKDVGARLMARGLAMPYPSDVEPARNTRYMKLARRAAAKRLNIYNPTHCRSGPAQHVQLGMRLMWDANGNDDRNLNGEYVVITNPSATAISLRGWVLRESSSFKYRFPRSASVPAMGSVTVHTGKVPSGKVQGWFEANGTDRHYYWGRGRSVFGNEFLKQCRKGGRCARPLGDGAYLFDPHGDIRSYAEYGCFGRCGDSLGAKINVRVHYAGTSHQMEWVDITNISSGPVNLTGYMLERWPYSYEIAAGTVLQPGEKLNVNMGVGTSSRLQQYWGNSYASTKKVQSFSNTNEYLAVRRIAAPNGRGVIGHVAKRVTFP